MLRAKLASLAFLTLTRFISPAAVCSAQQAVPAPSHPTSTPYSGSLDIFEYPGRAEKLQVDRIMDILRISPGKSVADIGAGGGFLTVHLARRVGPSGAVYAEDINPKAIQALYERTTKEHLTNVKPTLGTPDDPKLPSGTLDAVVFLKVYHEIANPVALLAKLKPALRQGARIGIIDKNGNGDDHGLRQATLEREMSSAGFRETARYDFTKADGEDYFLVYELR